MEGGRERNWTSWSCLLFLLWEKLAEPLRGRNQGDSVSASQDPELLAMLGAWVPALPALKNPGLYLGEAERAGPEIIPNFCFILHQPWDPEVGWGSKPLRAHVELKCRSHTATRWQH